MGCRDFQARMFTPLPRHWVGRRVGPVIGAACALLVLAGCGGGDSERIAELEAQIEELAQDQGDGVSATTSEPGVDVPADGEVSTTAPTVAEEPSPTTTVLEGSSTTTTFAPNEIVFAEPNGPTLQEAATVSDLRALAEIQDGPTDDLAGQIARLGPFPHVETIAGTDVRAVTFEMRSTFKDDYQLKGFEQTVRVDARTPATREDVDLALQASIVAAGFDPDPDLLSGRVWQRQFDGPDGWVNVKMTELEDEPGTFYEIDYVVFSEVPRPELLASSIQWPGNGPWGDGLLDQVKFEMSWVFDSYSMEIHHRFPDLNEEDLEAGIPFRLENSDWELARSVAFVDLITNGELGSSKITGFGTSNLAGTRSEGIQIFEYEGSR